MQANIKLKPTKVVSILGAKKKKLAALNDPTQLYLNELSKSELLTAEDEFRLGRLVQKGDQPARQEMIESNLRQSWSSNVRPYRRR